MDKIHNAIVLLNERIVADTAMGASRRKEKGLSRPPVRYRRAASYKISKARNVAAARSPRCIVLGWPVITTKFNNNDAPTIARAESNGT